jgi:transposase
MSTGRGPTLKRKVQSLIRQKSALALVGEGKPLTVVATELNVSVQTVRKHLRRALATESLFPSTLSAEEIAQLRQVQAEVLANSRQKAIQTHAVIAGRVGTEEERGMDATASARLLEAVVRSVDLEASLFGTKQPTKILEEQLRIQLTKVDGKISVHFDRDQLRPRWTPLAVTDSMGVPYAAPDGGNNLMIARGQTNGLESARSEIGD